MVLPLLSALAFFAGPSAAQTEIVKSEFIYETAPFPSCHASTIVQAAKGVLVAAWFGGTAESNPDVVVYSSRLVDGHWTEPKEVVRGFDRTGKQFACYNPVLFQPTRGPLLLFYKVGPGPQHWWGMMTTSKDGGATWEAPRRLPDGFFGPIKNKPVEIESGELLCPSSTEDQGWTVHFETTRDLGKTWEKTKPLNDPAVIGAIQPSILRLAKGKLRAVGRTQQGRVFAIDSADNGIDWGPMHLLDVPNPNSGIDAVTLADGRHLLVYNNTAKGRTPLDVAISEDGEKWRHLLTLESEPGEYSYPAVIQTMDGLVHVTYTWNRKRIKHVVLRV